MAARSFADSKRRDGVRSRQRDTIGCSSLGADAIELWQTARTIVHQPGDDLLRRAASEERASGQHFVQHATEREDVGASVDAIAADLLWRHVAERAEHDVRRRSRQRRTIAIEERHLDPTQGQTEVENLDRAVVGEKHVLRLEIAVDDAARVRRGEAVGDRHRDLHRLTPGNRALLQPRSQCPTFEQLHDRDRGVVDDGELVNREDARVRKGGDRARLGLEAAAHFRIGRGVRRHDLDGNVAVEPRIACPIHLAHAARSDGLDDFVLARDGRLWRA